MKHFVYEGVNLDYCKSSNSVWMDKGELDSIAEKFIAKRKKAKASSEYGIVDGVVDAASDGVFEFIGDAIVSLFDGI